MGRNEFKFIKSSLAIMALLSCFISLNCGKSDIQKNEEHWAQNTVNFISKAQSLFKGKRYIVEDGLGQYSPSLDKLIELNLLGAFTPDKLPNYKIEMILNYDKSNYKIFAIPIKSGYRAFFVDKTDVIRYTDDGSRPDKTSPDVKTIKVHYIFVKK